MKQELVDKFRSEHLKRLGVHLQRARVGQPEFLEGQLQALLSLATPLYAAAHGIPFNFPGMAERLVNAAYEAMADEGDKIRLEVR